MDAALLARAAVDPRLTPTAFRAVAYVATKGEGVHCITNTELSIVLGGGEKPIRAALQLAAHCGYLEHEPAGRAGHRLSLRSENDAPGGGDSETGEVNDALGGGVPEMTPLGEAIPGGETPLAHGLPYRAVPNGTATTTTPPPTADAGEGAVEGVQPVGTLQERIHGFLGPDVWALATTSGALTAQNLVGIVSAYGPTGTTRPAQVWTPADTPAERQGDIRAAVEAYAGKAQGYDTEYFHRFLLRVVRERRKAHEQPEPLAATGTDGPAGGAQRGRRGGASGAAAPGLRPGQGGDIYLRGGRYSRRYNDEDG